MEGNTAWPIFRAAPDPSTRRTPDTGLNPEVYSVFSRTIDDRGPCLGTCHRKSEDFAHHMLLVACRCRADLDSLGIWIMGLFQDPPPFPLILSTIKHWHPSLGIALFHKGREPLG